MEAAMARYRSVPFAVLIWAATLVVAAALAATQSHAQSKRNTLDTSDREVSASEIADALRPKPLMRSLGPAAPKENTAIAALTFETGSAELTAQSKAMLGKFGQAFKDLDGVPVLIEGHADPRGGEKYNLDLSRRRAASVRDYLVSQLGNDAKQFEVVGYGPTRLMDPQNPTAKVNRRVEFVTRNTP